MPTQPHIGKAYTVKAMEAQRETIISTNGMLKQKLPEEPQDDNKAMGLKQ